MGIMIIIIASELLIGMFALNTLSAVRAFTGAEGTWSKAQKDAVYDLIQYSRYRNEHDYLDFQNYLKVPNGNIRARLELEKQNPDLDIARQAFIESRINPEDVDGVIKLYSRFRHVYYFERAINVWKKRVPLVENLTTIGEQLHQEINSASPSEKRIAEIIKPLDSVHNQLAQLAEDFSNALGEGSRWIADLIFKLLLSIILIVGLGGLVLAFSLNRAIINGLNELNKIASIITNGDYSARAKIYSQNEIGTVAKSINIMTDELEKKILLVKQSEEAARNSEAQFRNLFENTSELIHSVQIPDRNILYANPAWLKTLEYTEEEAKKLFLANIIHPDFMELSKSFIEKINKGENIDRMEAEFISKSGKKIYVEGSVVSNVKAGVPQSTIAIFRNVTQRKKAEEKQAMLAAIIESSDDAIISITLDGTVTSWNQGAERLFGYTNEEISGHSVFVLSPPHKVKEDPELLEKIKKGIRIEHYETERIKKDGTAIPVAITLSPIKDMSGNINGVSKIVHDITDRKKAQEQIRQVVESSPNSLVLVDKEGKILLVNSQTEKLFGYSRSEMLEHKIEMLIPERFRQNHPDLRKGFMRAPKTRMMGETKNIFGLRKNGTEVPLEIGLSPVSSNQGIQVLATIVDITERKKAAEELKQTTEFLNTILENIPDMIFVKDAKELRFLRFNNAGEELLGFKKQDMIGKNDYDFFPKEQADFFTSKDRLVLKDGKMLDIPEESITTKYKGTRILDTKKIPVLDTNGEALYLLGISHDITERKKAEDELKKSNERFMQIFDANPIGMTITNFETGTFQYVNQSFIQIFGYSSKEVIGKTSMELNLVESEIRAKIGSRLRNGEEIKDIEVLARKKNGETFWSLASIQTLLIDGKKAILSSFHDITDRKKAAEQFQQIVESSPNALILVNKEGEIILANSQTEKLFGYNPKDLITQKVEILIPERYRKTHPDHRNGFFVKPELRTLKGSPDVYGLRKNGTEVPLEISLSPISGPQGMQALATIVDITERKKVVEELKQKSEELIRSNTELEQFAYVASHDLQEPLRMVTSYLQLLENRYKDKLDKDANEFIAFAVDGSARMKTLILSLLEYSRVNKVKPFEEIDVNQLLKDVLKNISTSIKESNAIIKIDELPKIKGDPILINQLFQNLIENGIKFREARTPEIHISGKKENNEYIFSVQDNGIGIKKEYMNKLFVIFQRLNSKEKYPGTGIGLAICKKIVEKHGGKIWVESEENKGSTFYFTIKDNGN